jgi:hypothetical protein
LALQATQTKQEMRTNLGERGTKGEEMETFSSNKILGIN